MSIFRKISTAVGLVSFLSLSAFATDLRVMSYNINGLPWPLKTEKKSLFMEIARIINQDKSQGRGPDVLLLQEGFRAETLDMVEALKYPYIYRDDTSNGFPILGTRALIGSGLWILSQYPILKKESRAFGAGNCTGYDCLADKGVAYVQIDVPGVGPVDILSTHMNSNKASGSSEKEVQKAQKKQIQIAKSFFEKVSRSEVPIIFSGDFNIRSNGVNYPDLITALPLMNAGMICGESIGICEIGESTPAEDLHISHDQHFFRMSDGYQVTPVYAAKTMREKLGDQALSDHLAYTVTYRFLKK